MRSGGMVSIPFPKVRTAAGLMVLSVALSGCSLFGHERKDSTPPPPPTASVSSDSAASEAAAEPEVTAVDAALENAPAQTETVQQPDNSIFKADAPKSYVVKRGDTLWD